jgi:hypothetical protein
VFDDVRARFLDAVVAHVGQTLPFCGVTFLSTAIVPPTSRGGVEHAGCIA